MYIIIKKHRYNELESKELKMKHQFSRNELAIGQEGLELLKNKTVAVLGVGGVGSFAAEALARTNICLLYTSPSPRD